MWPERRQILLGAFLATFLLSLPSPAFAQDVRGELHETLEHIESSTARNKQLSAEYLKLEGELTSMQKDLIGMAAEIQRDERALSKLESQQAKLEREETEKRDSLTAQRNRLAQVSQAIIRLSQTPEEAVIAMPGEYPDMLRTARVLGLATSSLREQAETLQNELQELARLQDAIERNKETLRKDRQGLDARRLLMDAQLKSRKKLQLEVYNAREKESERLEQLSRKSASLQELIRTLETRERERADAEKTARQTPQSISRPSSPAASAQRALRSFAKAKGQISWPAQGSLFARFGSKKGKNETAKGVTVQTRDNAQVTAPYDGEVVFAGPFMAYGRIVILRHSGDFHTLLAGLNRIDCVPGQFLLEGEPVGVMGTKSNGENSLYLELRQDNRPVDPLPWMAGLSGPQHG